MFAFGAALLVVLVTLPVRRRRVGASRLSARAWPSGWCFGALTDLALKSGIGNVRAGVALRRLVGLPRSVFGTALAHLGLGLTVLGIVGVVVVPDARPSWSMKPGQTLEIVRPPRCASTGCVRCAGPNFTEDQGRFSLLGAAGQPVAARSSRPSASTRSRQMPTTEAGIRTMWLQPALRFARRRDAGWLGRGARLVEAAGHADLGRRAGDDGGRRRVADGSPPAGGRTRAPQVGRGQDQPGDRHEAQDCRQSLRSLAAMLVAGNALAVKPSEMLADPALEARARAAFRRAALHGLPEPVDRRIGCRARRRPARAGARASACRRHRRAGDGLHRLALRRVRAAEAALQSAQRPAVGSAGADPAGWRGIRLHVGAFAPQARNRSPHKGRAGCARRLSCARKADLLQTLRKFHPSEMAL